VFNSSEKQNPKPLYMGTVETEQVGISIHEDIPIFKQQ
jgi:hypothetical protein